MMVIERKQRWWLRWHPLASEIDRRVPVDWVVKRSTVSHKHRYCYFRIPKCANSTVIRTLVHYDRSLCADAESLTLARIKRSTGGLFRARAWSPRSLARRYRCFTVVRNPYTRLLSAYLDKIAAATPDQYGYVARAAGKESVRGVSFAEFVGFLERGGLYANPHWAPQVALLPLDPQLLAFVGRVESLEEDLPNLIDLILGPSTFSGTRSREDRRRHSSTRLGEFYTPELINRVERLYAEDFRTFGYPAAFPAPEARP